MYDVYECKKNYAEIHVLLDTLIEIEQSSNPNSVFPDRKDASSAAHFNGFVVPPFLEPTQFLYQLIILVGFTYYMYSRFKKKLRNSYNRVTVRELVNDKM